MFTRKHSLHTVYTTCTTLYTYTTVLYHITTLTLLAYQIILLSACRLPMSPRFLCADLVWIHHAYSLVAIHLSIFRHEQYHRMRTYSDPSVLTFYCFRPSHERLRVHLGDRRAATHSSTSSRVSDRNSVPHQRKHTALQKGAYNHIEISRRTALFSLSLGFVIKPHSACAIGFTKELKKRNITDAEYKVSESFIFRSMPHEGVQFFDTREGNGEVLSAGKTALVHYTCRYRGLTAVSSREARTLGGNRTIAEPLEIKYGTLPKELNRPVVRNTIVGIGAEVRE